MNKLETNVLVLGKTGVGKSTFINYIYGKNVMKQKAGKPVTEYGLHKDTFELGALSVNIYDSWGLEADKANQWETLISAEIKKHNETGRIKDWFHTIYYCFSANSARVEDFEIDKIIKPLIRANNNITFIITHYNKKKNDDKVEAMIKEITTRLNISREDIIKVSSKESKTLGGFVEKCGREEVLKRLKENLWDDIKKRIPLQYKQDIVEKVKNWREISYNIVNDENSWEFNYIKMDSLKAIEDSLKNTFEEINEMTRKYIEEACCYYSMIVMNICNPYNVDINYEELKFLSEDMINRNKILNLVNSKILVNIPTAINISELLADFAFLFETNLIIGGITFTISKLISMYGKKYVIQKLKEAIDSQYINIHNEIPIIFESLQTYLNSLDIDQILFLEESEVLV